MNLSYEQVRDSVETVRQLMVQLDSLSIATGVTVNQAMAELLKVQLEVSNMMEED